MANRRRLGCTVAAAALLATTSFASAADRPAPIEASRPDAARLRTSRASEIRAAVERSIVLIEASGAESRRQRQCFTCHHQALPTLALTEARRRGFVIDSAELDAQLDHAAAHLLRGRDGYREGRGQGGQVDTAGWALWALEVGGRQPDETTAAVAGYLLSHQQELGRWRPSSSQRRPTQGSEFTATYLALRGLAVFGTPEQAEPIDARTGRASAWLREAKPADTEDRVFRLRSLSYLGSGEAVTAAAELLAMQRPDGSWSQTGDGDGDAYATGTVLVALQEAGRLSTEDAAYRRAVAYLLDTQRPDGSWRVATHARPVQTYFESGFPHGRDQFISMAATCWATTALLLTCPEADSAAGTPSHRQK